MIAHGQRASRLPARRGGRRHRQRRPTPQPAQPVAQCCRDGDAWSRRAMRVAACSCNMQFPLRLNDHPPNLEVPVHGVLLRLGPPRTLPHARRMGPGPAGGRHNAEEPRVCPVARASCSVRWGGLWKRNSATATGRHQVSTRGVAPPLPGSCLIGVHARHLACSPSPRATVSASAPPGLRPNGQAASVRTNVRNPTRAGCLLRRAPGPWRAIPQGAAHDYPSPGPDARPLLRRR